MDVQSYFDLKFSEEDRFLPADVARAGFVRDLIPEEVHTVLDAGCGTGAVARVVGERYSVFGLDLSGVGARRLKAAGVPCVQGSIAAIPFPARSFDMVMANEVLEHLDVHLFRAAIQELRRVADRYLLITVPNKDRLRMLRQECPACRTKSVPWGHLRSFDLSDLERLFVGFELCSSGVFGPLVPDHRRLLTRFVSLPRRWYNPLRPGERCPICGYLEKPKDLPASGTGMSLRRAKTTWWRLVDFMIRKLSRKKQRWLFALYRRVPSPGAREQSNSEAEKKGASGR